MSVIQNVLQSYFKDYPVEDNTPIAVAVSGGADSLCLAIELAEYAKKNHLMMYALTVNHGLRREALIEAQEVKRVMKSFGVSHTILTWRGAKPTTRVEEKAREKRYDLMLKWCRANKVSHLFLAHHLGDQVETFWARLARGSGIDGLAAMGTHTMRSGIFLCRPFLNLTKEECQKELKKRKMTWAEDPMNRDDYYERVRWRQAQKSLSQMGLNERVIGRTIGRMARVKGALNFYTDRFVNSLVDWSGEGYATIQEKAFRALPDEIQVRVLERVLAGVGQGTQSLSLERMEQWVSDFPIKATLHYCLLLRQRGLIYIAKEAIRMQKAQKISKNKIILWDRFMVKSPVDTTISVGGQNKELPAPVRKSVPITRSNLPIVFRVGAQKVLEKQMQVDYKDVIQIGFIKETP